MASGCNNAYESGPDRQSAHHASAKILLSFALTLSRDVSLVLRYNKPG